jgi:hypothetical protein
MCKNLFSNEGQRYYHYGCITKILGKNTLHSAKYHLQGFSVKMISKCQRRIKQEYSKNSPNKVTQVQHGLKTRPSNFSHHYDFVRCIFRTFVIKNRMSNHRKKGKKRYFLLSQWTSMSHKSSNTPQEHCLSYTFNTVLKELHTQGNIAAHVRAEFHLQTFQQLKKSRPKL